MADNRPGIMVYFDDVLPSLKCLTLEETGRLFIAMLEYGKHGAIPDFRDSVGLNVAWGFISQKIDRDSMRYEKSLRKSKYGAYKRETMKRGEEPLSFEDWHQQEYGTQSG